MRKRRKAREITLQNLFAIEISQNPIERVIENIQEMEGFNQEILDFACTLLRKVINHRESLDNDVSLMIQNWEYERVALIDRLILRQSLCEFLHFSEIPPKVTINEAIDLAKKFSTAESGRFVNGVLDGLFKKLVDEDRIEKKGRGLVG